MSDLKHDGPLPTTWEDRGQSPTSTSGQGQIPPRERAGLQGLTLQEIQVLRQCRGWTALSVASAGLAASGVGVLTTIIAAPVAVGLQAGAIACGLLGAGGRFICRRLEAKARKHDQIRVLAESKLNTIADRILTALTDDKISEEEFRLILSEVDKHCYITGCSIVLNNMFTMFP